MPTDKAESMVQPTGRVPVPDVLVRRLAEYGVRHIFGYPGGQLTPIYDALTRVRDIRHYLARHEQAAAFMADGYARATGRPGVSMAVCGPGVFNAATPLCTAFTDSTPLLLISGQVPSKGRGLRSGYYHENDQLRACTSLTKARFHIDDVSALVPGIDAAWEALTTGRPGPVLFQVPLDLLRTDIELASWPALPPPPRATKPEEEEIVRLARRLQNWQRPLLLIGGGVLAAGAERVVVALAERLGAPVLNTAMGKSAFPASHSLAAGLTWSQGSSDLTGMEDFLSPLLGQADGLLAIGCRFSQLATGSWALRPPPELAQIDIDEFEIGRHYPVELGICGDARMIVEQLLTLLPPGSRKPWTTPPPRANTWRLPGIEVLAALRRVLPPDGIISADVTRLGYMVMADFPLDQPRTFLHPAGAVSMGFGIPAALGAKAAFPKRKVIAVVGDGGFQMSALELATAVQERLPIVIILINDDCLTLIKATQQRRYGERYIAVDLQNPDFALFSRAFGVDYARVETDEDFEVALAEALDRETTTLIEIRPGSSGRGAGI
jgi:acetolactate synthase I/II/III large subunit